MNDIIMCGQNLGAITNSITSDFHKHWMLQLFISDGDKLEINVEGQKICCRAIAINVNIMHEFYSGNSICFTMLVNPTTQLGRSMRMNFLRDKPYYIFCEDKAVELQMQLLNVIRIGSSNYSDFMKNVVSYFDIYKPIEFDKRIEIVLRMIEHTCNCEKISLQVKNIAKAMFISESRLSHLFKEEIGMPLKSYIVLHKIQSVYEKIFDNESITNAAIASGFDSSAHFAFTNKKMTGMSTRSIITDSRFLKVIL